MLDVSIDPDFLPEPVFVRDPLGDPLNPLDLVCARIAGEFGACLGVWGRSSPASCPQFTGVRGRGILRTTSPKLSSLKFGCSKLRHGSVTHSCILRGRRGLYRGRATVYSIVSHEQAVGHTVSGAIGRNLPRHIATRRRPAAQTTTASTSASSGPSGRAPAHPASRRSPPSSRSTSPAAATPLARRSLKRSCRRTTVSP